MYVSFYPQFQCLIANKCDYLCPSIVLQFFIGLKIDKPGDPQNYFICLSKVVVTYIYPLVCLLVTTNQFFVNIYLGYA